MYHHTSTWIHSKHRSRRTCAAWSSNSICQTEWTYSNYPDLSLISFERWPKKVAVMLYPGISSVDLIRWRWLWPGNWSTRSQPHLWSMNLLPPRPNNQHPPHPQYRSMTNLTHVHERTRRRVNRRRRLAGRVEMRQPSRMRTPPSQRYFGHLAARVSKVATSNRRSRRAVSISTWKSINLSLVSNAARSPIIISIISIIIIIDRRRTRNRCQHRQIKSMAISTIRVQLRWSSVRLSLRSPALRRRLSRAIILRYLRLTRIIHVRKHSHHRSHRRHFAKSRAHRPMPLVHQSRTLHRQPTLAWDARITSPHPMKTTTTRWTRGSSASNARSKTTTSTKRLNTPRKRKVPHWRLCRARRPTSQDWHRGKLNSRPNRITSDGTDRCLRLFFLTLLRRRRMREKEGLQYAIDGRLRSRSIDMCLSFFHISFPIFLVLYSTDKQRAQDNNTVK